MMVLVARGDRERSLAEMRAVSCEGQQMTAPWWTEALATRVDADRVEWSLVHGLGGTDVVHGRPHFATIGP